MPAPEKLTIDTPEQIALEFTLAGIGSRFLALAFDTLLQVSALLALVLAALVIRWAALISIASLRPWGLALLLIGAFLVYSAYFATFEVLWRGQTPGKRLVGLRVIDASGRPASVYSILIRNLIRSVDSMPGIYAVGILSVLVTSRQQRLGDLAAGTVVIHERRALDAPSSIGSPQPARHGARRLSPDEVALIESFLHRRADLDSYVRWSTAQRIAKRMAERLALTGVEEDDPEGFLEELAAEYRSASRYP